jgi:hypothetical protein
MKKREVTVGEQGEAKYFPKRLLFIFKKEGDCSYGRK